MNKDSIIVQKFGGGVIKDGQSIGQMGKILESQAETSVLVISAMGKTTNLLERMVNKQFAEQSIVSEMDQLKQFIINICQDLFGASNEVYSFLNDLLVELEWALGEIPENNDFDYSYDQVVGIGELISSYIVCSYLQEMGLPAVWVDARDVIRTDAYFRNARVDMNQTLIAVDRHINTQLQAGSHVVIQGFIGSTSDNAMTTLGREGSDYTAALLAYLMDVPKVIIWKNVPGIMSGDPTHFANVKIINKLSYREIVEMTFFGAKVLHPKTIQPLENKGILLNVRPFHDPESTGSLIHHFENLQYPPIVVQEKNQVLLHLTTLDFSFIAEKHLQHIFSIFSDRRIKINLMRNTAISFNVCINFHENEFNALLNELQQEYDIAYNTGVSLITIRHAIPTIVKEMKKDKLVLLEERHGDTLQMVVRDKQK